MSRVRIRLFHENNAVGETKLVRTVWVDGKASRKLTGKKAAKILANNFPDFDNSFVRNGLIKTEDGWWARRIIKPTEKCEFHYIWENACVNEEPEE